MVNRRKLSGARHANARAFSTREQKIVWLTSHAHLWVDWDKDTWKHRDDWKVVIDLMKKARLVSMTTYVVDVNLPLLIAAARERLKGGKDGEEAQTQIVEEKRT